MAYKYVMEPFALAGDVILIISPFVNEIRLVVLLIAAFLNHSQVKIKAFN